MAKRGVSYDVITITESAIKHIAYHNIFKQFLDVSKFSYQCLCTLFGVQWCQFVIRNLMYIIMCRLDIYVNFITRIMDMGRNSVTCTFGVAQLCVATERIYGWIGTYSES